MGRRGGRAGRGFFGGLGCHFFFFLMVPDLSSREKRKIWELLATREVMRGENISQSIPKKNKSGGPLAQ